jgi:hypothetical protein
MNCLHGKPAVYSTTSNGTFWFVARILHVISFVLIMNVICLRRQ